MRVPDPVLVFLIFLLPVGGLSVTAGLLSVRRDPAPIQAPQDPTAQPAADPLAAVRASAQHVALVDGWMGSGSGFPVATVGGRTAYLTAGHVVRTAGPHSVVLADGRSLPIVRMDLPPDQSLDAGLVWVDGVESVIGIGPAPAPLARVWSAGWPQGVALVLSEGYEAGSIVRRPTGLGACSAMVCHGSSGGAVLDAEGHAVGIVVQLWEFVAVYVPIDAAMPWVAESLAR